MSYLTDYTIVQTDQEILSLIGQDSTSEGGRANVITFSSKVETCKLVTELYNSQHVCVETLTDNSSLLRSYILRNSLGVEE